MRYLNKLKYHKKKKKKKKKKTFKIIGSVLAKFQFQFIELIIELVCLTFMPIAAARNRTCASFSAERLKQSVLAIRPRIHTKNREMHNQTV